MKGNVNGIWEKELLREKCGIGSTAENLVLKASCLFTPLPAAHTNFNGSWVASVINGNREVSGVSTDWPRKARGCYSRYTALRDQTWGNVPGLPVPDIVSSKALCHRRHMHEGDIVLLFHIMFQGDVIIALHCFCRHAVGKVRGPGFQAFNFLPQQEISAMPVLDITFPQTGHT